MKPTFRAAAGAAVLAVTLAACGGGSSSEGGGGDAGQPEGQITYWLWEAAQLQAYQSCQKAFEAKNPEFANKGQLEPLDKYIERDKVPTNIYQPGLADLWVTEDKKRYGLPKDWDTIAIFYNKKMVKDAGISEQQLQNLTWNPKDGGTYEKVIARLTVDKNGKRGDEAGFDKNNVKVYGLGLEASGGNNAGQGQWSMYAASNGWQATNKNPWGTQ